MSRLGWTRNRMRRAGAASMLGTLVLLPLAVAATPPAADFERFERAVRDATIPRTEARRRFAGLVAALERDFAARSCVATPRGEWSFPMEGYGPGDVGGGGSGYRPAGYDFFDGNRHGGHPSHDVFIRDRDQDELDDRTHAPVRVRSISSGIVAAVNAEWKPGSALRGGRYVWVYDTVSGGFFYYAHLRRIAVEPGQCVIAGAQIGEVGRTGLRASERRSPTHLHLTYLKITPSGPVPEDVYRDLSRSRGPR